MANSHSPLSVAGVVAAPGSATYSASKFAVEGLTDALRLEVCVVGEQLERVLGGGARGHCGYNVWMRMLFLECDG